MDKVFIVFAREKSNPFAARVVVGIANTIEAARRISELNEDTSLDCVIQEWDVESMQDLNNKVPWYVTLWNGGDTFTVRRTRLSDNANAKRENKILTEDYNSHFILVWADNKDEAIEEARRMLNEGNN